MALSVTGNVYGLLLKKYTSVQNQDSASALSAPDVISKQGLKYVNRMGKERKGP
jgi:hypothetical protein